jgi:Ice-binding-like
MLSAGNVTLDAQCNANAVFIFQIGSTLTTIGSTQVVLAGGAQAKNVFWQVATSATLGTNSIFQGNILSLQSITLDTGATLIGRALARNGAVTLESNTLTAP